MRLLTAGRWIGLGLLLAVASACAQLEGLTKSEKPAPVVSGKVSKPAKQPADKIVRLPARVQAPKFNDLKGLSPGHLLALLGTPVLRRKDPPAQHWRYDAQDCSLHLFFYETSGGFRLTHGDARRPRSAGQKTVPVKTKRDPCIAQIWRAGPNRKRVGES